MSAAVLMTTDTVGGVLTYTAELVRALAPDADVVLATMGEPLREDQRALLSAAGAESVHDGGYALEWMPGRADQVQAAGQWLLELEARVRPDLVHLNGYAHGALPWSVPRVVVGHSCVLSWWRAVHGVPAPPAWDGYRAAVVDGLNAADAVVAPTQTMLAQLADLYGEWPGEAIVIHNGSSAVPWSDQSPESPQSPQSPKAPFVLGAGRLWDQAKNVVALDRAAEGLPWPVLVAGRLEAPDGLPTPTSSACPLGELTASKLAALRRRAAVFAAPALYEPFGLAILEAAQDACALVLGDIPSLRELWDGAARFVAPHDHRTLHAVLSELTRDAAQREQLGRAAHRRARQFGTETMGGAYRELYTRLSTRTGALR